MILYREALRIILDEIRDTLPTETTPLVLSAGRVLAQDIVAAENIPSMPNSAMDGYAVCTTDLAQASSQDPIQLRVIGEVAAGAPFAGEVNSGEAVRIMTGGIIPNGADGIIEVESTSEENGVVSVHRSILPGNSIRSAGEDIQAGQVVIAKGKKIGPGDIGVLASLGVTNVPVRVKPKVAILSTGNEVIEAHKTPSPGQLRNSSGPALYAACVETGGEPIDIGIAGDDRDQLEDGLEQGLRFDILLTTGGVSAGAYDLVQHLLPELGVEICFHKVNIKPGKPVLFGLYKEGGQRTLVFGLPGNPVSSLVTFYGLVAPAIRAMLGAWPEPLQLSAELEEDIIKKDGKRHSIRGILRHHQGSLLVRTTGTQSSGAMSSMSKGNCLIIVDEETSEIRKGTLVTVELLEWIQ